MVRRKDMVRRLKQLVGRRGKRNRRGRRKGDIFVVISP